MLVVAACALAACGGTNHSPIRIGVMLPLTGPDQVGYRTPLEWARQSVNAAGGIDGRALVFVYRDLGRESVTNVANEFATDPSIVAVIGPANSEDARQVTSILINHRKPIVSPAATSADLFRAFSSYSPDFFWRPVESDIAQVRTMLNLAIAGGAHSVALVSGASPYGNTFFDWFGFLATQDGLRITSTTRYDQSEMSCRDPLDRALASHADAVLAVPDHASQAICMAREWRARGSRPRLLFSDGGQEPSLVSDLGARSDGIEGTGLSADPKSGFPAAFQARFHRPPSPYAANAYDSVLMLAYGLQRSDGDGGDALAKAISQVTSGRGQPLRWDAVAKSLAAIKAGRSPFIQGAVGPWMFDKNSGIKLVASTYQHWTVKHGRFDVTQYISTDRSATAEAGVSAQKARPSLDRAHSTIGGGYTPGPRKGGWALLVAASGDWTNYRHQADVMAQYQRLRQGGVPPDHIVVVAANNLARNPRNPRPPNVPYTVGGGGLNDGFQVDYPLHGMTSDRLMEILSGRASARNPKVIRAGPGDDVYVYLAGHGNQNGLYLGLGEAVPDPGHQFSVLTPSLLDDTINSMAKRHAYRRMLVVVEACEGGVLGQDLTAPGALLLSAANSTENSLSANYDTDRHTWLADQFSYQLYQAVAQSPNASIDDIYQHLYLNVEGSHVSAYGPRFGDARTVQLKEFLAG